MVTQEIPLIRDMLSLSKKSKYGLKALLALAESYDQGLLQIKDIAAKQNIPRQYLEQIFNQLGKANIIKSVRGKYGGYKLARRPAEIMAAEIITLLEGGIEFIPVTNEPADVVYELFHKAEEKVLEVLAVSLADLLTQQQLRRNVILYDI